MVIHHIVTTILLVLSYNTGFFRIGCVIILLHDVSDVFLEVSCILCLIANSVFMPLNILVS